MGDYDQAIQVCREGLRQHPGYVSARVTLGRALLETGQHEQARAELEAVLRVAPDNLAAIRALGEIQDQGPGIGDQGSADPIAGQLESWLGAIIADREERRAKHRAGSASAVGNAPKASG